MPDLTQQRLTGLLKSLVDRCESIRTFQDGTAPTAADRNWFLATDLLTTLQETVELCRQLGLARAADQFNQYGTELDGLTSDTGLFLLSHGESPAGMAAMQDTFGPFPIPTNDPDTDGTLRAVQDRLLVGIVLQLGDYAGSLLRDIRSAERTKRTEAAANERDTLTPPQVAKRLGVDPTTVMAWIRSGQLKASNVGKGPQRARFRIQPTDLDTFLKSRQPQPAAKPTRRAKLSDDEVEYF